MFKNKETFLGTYPGLSEGMPVYSSNGDKLGKISTLGDDFVIVQKGVFFPKDFTLRYDDISDIRDDSVYLNFSGSDLADWRSEAYPGWTQTEDFNAGRLQAEPRDEYRDRYATWSNEQIRVPVAEEELQATKTARSAGEVRVHKIVHSELKHFTVPVMREEVRVERVPVTDREAGAVSGETNFEEKTINIPVMEEEVTVTKRPVVKEEVRISKDRTTEERTVQGEVRKEEVRVEGEDTLKRKKAG